MVLPASARSRVPSVEGVWEGGSEKTVILLRADKYIHTSGSQEDIRVLRSEKATAQRDSCSAGPREKEGTFRLPGLAGSRRPGETRGKSWS